MEFEILSEKSPESKILAAAELLCEHLGSDGSMHLPGDVALTVRGALSKGIYTRLVLASVGKSPVGVCFANRCVGIESGGDYLWVNEMYIRPDYRSQGAGRELFDFVTKMARDEACLRIVAWTGKGNLRSQKFFSENGFNLSDVVALDLSLNDD